MLRMRTEHDNGVVGARMAEKDGCGPIRATSQSITAIMSRVRPLAGLECVRLLTRIANSRQKSRKEKNHAIKTSVLCIYAASKPWKTPAQTSAHPAGIMRLYLHPAVLQILHINSALCVRPDICVRYQEVEASSASVCFAPQAQQQTNFYARNDKGKPPHPKKKSSSREQKDKNTNPYINRLSLDSANSRSSQ